VQVEKVAIKALLWRRWVETREGDELDQLWLFGFVVGEDEVAADIEVEDFANVGWDFVRFVHEDA
jgi:hypothetical protein